MDFNNITDIEANGFVGFKKISDLWIDHSFIPNERGVYLVLTTSSLQPNFLSKGSGGFFKGNDPNVYDLNQLKNKWVEKAQVVYIGKATSLKKRLNQYLCFGQGKNIGHW